MDRLDDTLGTVAPLLKRVDEVLAWAGAPADHDIWPALRQVRLLTWDSAQAVAALRPADLADAATELRQDARSYAGVAESLPAPGGWAGTAADAYDRARKHAAAHLSGGPDSLDERLEATADLADALTDWMRSTRDGLAATLAEVLTSAEALSLSETPTDPPTVREVEAAAEVAARVLRVVAGSYDTAEELMTGSAALTTPARL